MEDNVSTNGVEGKKEGTTPIQINSNGVEAKELLSSNDSRQHLSSATKTKTASFSQNTFSEELFKVQQYLSGMSKQKRYEESLQDMESQPPPGFEKVLHPIIQQQEGQLKPKTINSFQHLETDEDDLSNHINPQGTTELEGSLTGQKKNQKKKNNIQKPSYKKVLLRENSVSSESTSESLIQLAQDSLKFGELIGVRVTGDVEAAISRITSPLKKSRKQAKGLNRQ